MRQPWINKVFLFFFFFDIGGLVIHPKRSGHINVTGRVIICLVPKTCNAKKMYHVYVLMLTNSDTTILLEH